MQLDNEKFNITDNNSLRYIMKVSLFLVLTLKLFGDNRAEAQSDLSSRIDKLFTSYIDSGFAGSVLVAKENTVVLKKGYGYSNNQTKSINTPATLLMQHRSNNSPLMRCYFLRKRTFARKRLFNEVYPVASMTFGIALRFTSYFAIHPA
jgi:hypothetical protein